MRPRTSLTLLLAALLAVLALTGCGGNSHAQDAKVAACIRALDVAAQALTNEATVVSDILTDHDLYAAMADNTDAEAYANDNYDSAVADADECRA